jgi:hypothetical protein
MKTAQTINGDLAARVAVDTAAMEWTPSPSGTVWRKRVHLVGPVESGQVTSVVHYEPRSTFHGHDHPDGEEILVLDGVFSDEHGDWPAGTYLLNPEGFRHAPFSREGCVLFVKLRQFPGRTRAHVVTRTDTVAWQPTARAGVAVRPLYSQAGFADSMRLERWSARARRRAVRARRLVRRRGRDVRARRVAQVAARRCALAGERRRLRRLYQGRRLRVSARRLIRRRGYR